MAKEQEKLDKKKGDCPLCEVSSETIKRLKESQEKKVRDEQVKNNGERRD